MPSRAPMERTSPSSTARTLYRLPPCGTPPPPAASLPWPARGPRSSRFTLTPVPTEEWRCRGSPLSDGAARIPPSTVSPSMPAVGVALPARSWRRSTWLTPGDCESVTPSRPRPENTAQRCVSWASPRRSRPIPTGGSCRPRSPRLRSSQNGSLQQSFLRSPQNGALEQMLYRVTPAGTDAQLRTATQAITAHVPHGAVQSVGSYLDVKRNADIVAAVMVPFLLAFSVFALVASGLIIGNVVGGVVVSSYRDIGVMRAVGFTPMGVIGVLMLQILVPALAGCLAGIVLGTVASQPFLSDTAHALGLPTAFTAALPVDLGVPVVIAVVVFGAAFLPSRRAGAMSAVDAITLGSAPARSGASGIGRFALGLSLPRPFALGLADAFSRPLRSAMTLGAIVTGVATVIFALNLHLSLGLVAEHVDRDQYAQVDVYPISAADPGAVKGGALPSGLPGARLQRAHAATILRNDPGTAHFVAEGPGGCHGSRHLRTHPLYRVSRSLGLDRLRHDLGTLVHPPR